MRRHENVFQRRAPVSLNGRVEGFSTFKDPSKKKNG